MEIGQLGVLASQTAARKLGQILGLLVIPIIVMWLAYFLNARTEIDGLNRELADVHLTQSELGRAHQIENPQALSKDIASQAEMATKALRLESDRLSVWRNFLLLTIAGALSVLAGIFLAVKLMRSTLLRLDGVEQSRAEAQEARRDAEQMTLQLSTINSDISNLNQELAIKVRELKSVQDELIKKGKLEQLGQLTATIAHEIRNPLGAIRTSAFLLERRTATLGGDVSGHFQRINNGVNRCDTIISQLLDFSRTKEVNSSLALLDDWLANIVREEAQKLPDNIFIECALGLEGVKLAFDPARLQRAVINLLNNACEAFSHHDAGLRPTIWVTTLRSGDFATIRIADNGPGIMPENLQKIREPLFTTKSFGTGLGLPAAEQIVVQHQGRLEISSEVGAGAIFTLFLPLPMIAKEAA